MAIIESPQALLELLRSGQPEDKLNIDASTVRYALYVRKSTQGDERQERSIEDQISDCMDRVLIPNGIKPAMVIKEKFSAKEPGARIKFNELIDAIKSTRVTGIIAWHPDRLARNMGDAGKIIDLLDNGSLRDLKFATFTFENNPAGKMLLGISFVLSKQYSEHLSETVTRGNKRAVEDDGQFIGKLKHGYYIDTNRHLQPDDAFVHVQNMFKMRLDGKSQKEILEWINKQGYKVRRRGKDPETFTWDKDDVSNLLRDPVYAGILQWGNSTVNLIEKYGFVPMISVSEFSKINNIDSVEPSKIRAAITVKSGEIRANLLRGMVNCGACHESLTSMIIDKKKHGKIIASYYYYKCETPNCPMRNKAARANLVINTAIDFFTTHLFVTKDNYNTYIKNAKQEIKRKAVELESQIASLKSRIGEKQRKYDQTKDLLLDNHELAEYYDLSALSTEIESMRKELTRLTDKKNRSKSSFATFEQYLKLLESTPVILGKIHDMEIMDALLKIFFSNFAISPANDGTFKGSQVTYKLKEPWAGFLKDGKFVDGAASRTYF